MSGSSNGRSLSRLQPVQQRMLEVLSDGLPHLPEELHACLSDDMGPVRNVNAHLTHLRRYLEPLGQDVMYRRGCYRIVHIPPFPRAVNDV